MEEYRLEPPPASDDGEEPRVGYGAAVYRDGQLMRRIADISPDRPAVARLVRLFNEEALDPVHFEQAVEDFLYDNRI